MTIKNLRKALRDDFLLKTLNHLTEKQNPRGYLLPWHGVIDTKGRDFQSTFYYLVPVLKTAWIEVFAQILVVLS